jgi:hypothetical protein
MTPILRSAPLGGKSLRAILSLSRSFVVDRLLSGQFQTDSAPAPSQWQPLA